MKNLMTPEKMMTVMNSLYDRAIDGIAGAGTAEELAIDYLKGEGSLADKANRLIRYQDAKCATSGFVSGLGGLITLPVAIPANISSVMYVQARMVAAIAYMGGYDIRCCAIRFFWTVNPVLTGQQIRKQLDT